MGKSSAALLTGPRLLPAIRRDLEDASSSKTRDIRIVVQLHRALSVDAKTDLRNFIMATDRWARQVGGALGLMTLISCVGGLLTI